MSKTHHNSERQLGGIGHFIRRGAEIYPARIAIDDLLNKRTLTYAELDERVNKLAQGLLRHGIGRGDFVAAMMWNEHALVEVIFACARIGAIVAPLNVRLIAAEVKQYCEEHGCRTVIASNAFTERFEETDVNVRIAYGAAVADWHDYETILEAEDGHPLPIRTSLDDPYRLVMTGGTTGPSKGVLHSQGGTIFTTLSDVAEYGIGRGWQTVSTLPLYHVAGMEWGVFTILWRAGTVIFPPTTSFNPLKYINEVRSRGVQYLAIVPSMINPLYQAWDGTPISAPQTVVTTAAPTPLPLRTKLAEIFPQAKLVAGAGLSESLNMACQSAGQFLEHPNSVGEPHIDTRLLILDEEDRRVPLGTPGHVAVRNFNTALGYHLNEKASRTTWRKLRDDPEGLEWCFTGDIAVMDEKGVVSIVDRSKDVILTGGESVPSVEIEAIYAIHPSISESSVIGVQDEQWGEAIVLVAVPELSTTDDEALAKELFEFGRARMAGHKVPKRIAFIEELPRTHFGKVLKRDLREWNFERLFSAR